MSNVYEQMALSIIKEQESIIGPIAVERAKQVQGVTLNWTTQEVTITSEPIVAIQNLVHQYSDLFGSLSIQVCKDAVAPLISQLGNDQIPAVLQ